MKLPPPTQKCAFIYHQSDGTISRREGWILEVKFQHVSKINAKDWLVIYGRAEDGLICNCLLSGIDFDSLQEIA